MCFRALGARFLGFPAFRRALYGEKGWGSRIWRLVFAEIGGFGMDVGASEP